MEFEFDGEIIEWRGPAPFLVVRMREEDSELLATMPQLSYGWGCIAASVRIGATDFTTSLMPKDGRFLVPVKVAVQRAEGVGLGDTVHLKVRIAEP